MLIKEYRVTLPMTLDEYKVAQLFSLAEVSKKETGGGEGVQVIKNESFDNIPLFGGRFRKGQYTYKIYKVWSKLPGFIRVLIPKDKLDIHEEAWNAYPYCRTIITNPNYMKENFRIVVESHHLADRGTTENVHELSNEILKMREIVKVDIGNDPVNPSDYSEETDPSKFVSVKTRRGPFIGPWQESCCPVMTCYKLVSAEFKFFGVQNKVEKHIHIYQRRLMTKFHREVVCWMDRWYGLTMADIREIEDRTRQELDRERNKGQIRGTKYTPSKED